MSLIKEHYTFQLKSSYLIMSFLCCRCAADDTVKFLPSPSGYYRFTMEAFEFVNEPFVFIHCHLVICNASDTGSRCAKGCQKRGRVRRQVGSDEVYSLAQGPIMVDLVQDGEYEEYTEQLKQPNAEGK